MIRDKLGRFMKGKNPWNKGKKHKLKSIKKMSKTRKELIKEGKIIPPKGMLGKEAWNKGKKCIQFSKENHWNWKGGITPMNSLLRTCSKYKIWRELIFLRDNFTCQNPDCPYCHNKIGVYLHPHHIKSKTKFPELAFKIDNGITYCAEFHIKSGLHKGIMQKEY